MCEMIWQQTSESSSVYIRWGKQMIRPREKEKIGSDHEHIYLFAAMGPDSHE
jgi:hypothetical protein